MDPDATLRLIAEAVADGELTEADEACDDLRVWLQRGGFEPDWSRWPGATAYYHGRRSLQVRQTGSACAETAYGRTVPLSFSIKVF